MPTRVSLNRRLVAALLSLSLITMATASGASWQCPDGHPCPPGCLMAHLQGDGERATAHACCQTGSARTTTARCPMCPKGPALSQPHLSKGCTSSKCVLRYRNKPDALLHAAMHFLPDQMAVLAPSMPALVEHETRTTLYLLPPRAPPRPGLIRSHSPRAPPSLL